MKNQKTIFHLLFITMSAFCTTNVIADVSTSSVSNDDPRTLQSIASLQSLKQVQTSDLYTAPHVHELKNKYKVRSLFVESPALPMVDIQLTFNAGSARDIEVEKGLYGVANMSAQLIDEGTTQHDAVEIANAFEQVGARFSVAAHRDMFVVRLRSLSDPKKIDAAVSTMLEVLKDSTFKNNSISLMVSNTQVGQKQLKESPSRLMSIRFYRVLYGSHPYAEPITGTNGSIKKITTQHLKKFRDEFLVSQNMNIALTGQLSVKQAQKLAERISAALPQGEAAKPLALPQDKPNFDIQHIVFNSTQAHVTMGHLSTTRDDPDRLALELANRMLGGGGFSSILMKELRVKRGYTYGANSAFTFSQAAGSFSLSYSTQQDQLIDSIQVAHKALVDFVHQPIDAQQLEETKAGMLRSLPNSYSSNANINAQLGSIGFYQQDANYLADYPKRLAAITSLDVQNAIRKHIHPESLTLVIVSNALDKEQLRHILELNLDPNIKQSMPHPDQIPAIIEPPEPMPEAASPDSAQTDELALI